MGVLSNASDWSPSRIGERINYYMTQRLAAAVPINARPVRLRRPVASFSFDDFPDTAWHVGGPLLARYDAPATYFVSGSLCGTSAFGQDFCTPDDIRAVHRAGHEIGAHTYRHVRVPTMSSREFREDSQRNEEFLTGLIPGLKLESFAYPYGRTTLRCKTFVSRRYAHCRSTLAGVVTGRADMGQLPVVSLETFRWSKREIDTSIERVVAERGWVIFYTHDVRPDPTEWGSTPEVLDYALESVRKAGMDIMTIGEAARTLSCEPSVSKSTRLAELTLGS